MGQGTRRLVLATAFLSGAAVMAYELVGSRLVAPYLGTGIVAWTSIIGVILGSLSLGYYLGGRIADGNAGTGGFGLVLLSSGLLVLLTAALDRQVLEAVSSTGMPLEAMAILSALMLFAPASLALGCVSPYATRLWMSSLEHAGRDVGTVSAVSTAGSIAGTFAAGFWLVPAFGSSTLLYGIAGLLVALSLPFLPGLPLRTAALVLALLGGGYALARPEAPGLLLDRDTRYGRVQVVRTEVAGRPVNALRDAAGILQSASYLDSDEPVFAYVRAFRAVEGLVPGARRVLVIGGGTMSVSQDLALRNPSLEVDSVELDPDLLPIAREYFRYRDPAGVRAIAGDGRTFLNGNRTGYDAVLLDAYRSDSSVPFHLTTAEALGRVRHSLTPKGVVLANFIDSGQGEFLEREYATYLRVFPSVRAFAVAEESGTSERNVVFVASLLPGDARLGASVPGRELSIVPAYPVLTDDYAPAESLSRR